MDELNRKAFWETLISLDGKDKIKEFNVLKEKIELPRYIYRYRPITMESLEALRTNKLYFSKANYYDDPFDTYVYVDLKGLDNTIDSLNQFKEQGDQAEKIKVFVTDALRNVFKIDVSDDEIVERFNEIKKQLTNPVFVEPIKRYLRDIRNEMRKDIWSVCFSENGFNETLWLKYAQQYQGFVLQYDLTKEENLHCGNYEECKNCYVSNVNTPLYPIYYSDEQYDGTRLGQFVALCRILGLTPDNQRYEDLRRKMGGTQLGKRAYFTYKKRVP